MIHLNRPWGWELQEAKGRNIDLVMLRLQDLNVLGYPLLVRESFEIYRFIYNVEFSRHEHKYLHTLRIGYAQCRDPQFLYICT